MKPLLTLIGLSLLFGCSDATQPEIPRFTVTSEIVNQTTLDITVIVDGVPGISGVPETMQSHFVRGTMQLRQPQYEWDGRLASSKFETVWRFRCPAGLTWTIELFEMTPNTPALATDKGQAEC